MYFTNEIFKKCGDKFKSLKELTNTHNGFQPNIDKTSMSKFDKDAIENYVFTGNAGHFAYEFKEDTIKEIMKIIPDADEDILYGFYYIGIHRLFSHIDKESFPQKTIYLNVCTVISSSLNGPIPLQNMILSTICNRYLKQRFIYEHFDSTPWKFSYDQLIKIYNLICNDMELDTPYTRAKIDYIHFKPDLSSCYVDPFFKSLREKQFSKYIKRYKTCIYKIDLFDTDIYSNPTRILYDADEKAMEYAQRQRKEEEYHERVLSQILPNR